MRPLLFAIRCLLISTLIASAQINGSAESADVQALTVAFEVTSGHSNIQGWNDPPELAYTSLHDRRPFSK